MIPTDPDTGPVERADLVKGYEISKNHYVVMSNDELDAVKLETTRTIEIERFVDEKEIDRLYWNAPYYLVPNDKGGVEAYTVIREALSEAGRIALGRVVMHARERLVALEPRDKGMLCYTLRMARRGGAAQGRLCRHSRRQAQQADDRYRPQDHRAAGRPVRAGQIHDRYEEALRDLIRRKEKGEKLVTAEPVEEDNVIDLMAALKKSLARPGGPANKRARS